MGFFSKSCEEGRGFSLCFLLRVSFSGVDEGWKREGINEGSEREEEDFPPKRWNIPA